MHTSDAPEWHPDFLKSLIPSAHTSNGCTSLQLAAELSLYRQFYQLPEPHPEHGLCSHQIGYETVGDYRIAVQQWEHPAPRGNLILVHGYYDHVGLYGSVVRFCAEQGLNLLAFDLPGHGLSSGPRAEISHFDEYIEVFDHLYRHLTSALPGPWHALGQSTGGAILASWLLRQRPVPGVTGPQSVTLLAPLLKPSGWHLGKALTPLVGLFTQQLRRRFRHDGNTPEFSRFLEQHDPLQPHHLSLNWVKALMRWIPELERQSPLAYPVGLVQGGQDKTVHWRYNLPVYQRLFPDVRVLQMPGAHHHLVNDNSSHQSEMYQWLARHFMVLSSGTDSVQ